MSASRCHLQDPPGTSFVQSDDDDVDLHAHVVAARIGDGPSGIPDLVAVQAVAGVP
jgi:hypothetical protein